MGDGEPRGTATLRPGDYNQEQEQALCALCAFAVDLSRADRLNRKGAKDAKMRGDVGWRFAGDEGGGPMRVWLSPYGW